MPSGSAKRSVPGLRSTATPSSPSRSAQYAKRVLAGDTMQDRGDHPGAGAAGRGARVLEEGDVGARRAVLVGVEQVVDARIVLVDGLLDQPEAQHPRVEVDVAGSVTGDQRDVVDAFDWLHGALGRRWLVASASISPGPPLSTPAATGTFPRDRRARVPVHHLFQRHDVPGHRPGGGVAAGAARRRGRLPAGADMLRPDALQHRLRGRDDPARAPLREDVRRQRGGRLAVGVVRRDGPRLLPACGRAVGRRRSCRRRCGRSPRACWS